ncbi:pentatricopeptide repeat-containing protein At5g15280, mitochondrial-like [Macadamia integrifolia]|uniref:pentatricopeptide repeat-containing protein At5g15280, mitochondrial-like n=1 Tax=Macadamia integrifolia TaxID=60698 RepID=UPI001C4E89B7|nr:pentatricopeptide repeat-containing protein At5g15280, mitochondrial-like [Macadamia integrifolia]
MRHTQLSLVTYANLDSLEKYFGFLENTLATYDSTADVYNVFLEELSVNGYTNIGRVLMEEILGHGWILNQAAYDHIIRGFREEKILIEAFREMICTEKATSYLSVYSAIVKGFYKEGLSIPSYHNLGLLLDEVSYKFFVHGYLKFKDISRSEKAMKTMIDKDERRNNCSFGSIIRHLCNEGELDKALEIVLGSSTHGRLQEAEDFLDRIKHKCLILNSISYDFLLKGFCYYGRLNKAVDLMNIMVMKGNIPSSSSYDFVVESLCACNAFDQALFHAEMLDRKLESSVNTWDVLVSGLCKDGRTAQVEMLLDSMLQFGQSQARKYFEIHWSLKQSKKFPIANDGSERGGFLSKLFSWSGFTGKKDPTARRG